MTYSKLTMAKEINNIEYIFNSIFKSGIEFSENPFRNKIKYFLCFEYAFILDESFTEILERFIESTLFIVPIDIVNEVLLTKTKRNLLGKFNKGFTDKDMNEYFHRELDGSNLLYMIDSYAMFSENDDWGLISSVEWELGIIGFETELKMELFKNLCVPNGDMFFTIQKQIKIYDEMFEFSQEQKDEYLNLIENYNNVDN
jgi:hypothetical protein